MTSDLTLRHLLKQVPIFSASASSYGLPEHIGVVPVVVPELELRKIQRQIFPADVVVGSEDSPFKQSPEGIEALSVNLATDVLACGVVHGFMRIATVQSSVPDVFISGNQFNLRAYGFSNEILKRVGAQVLDDATNHIPFAANRADDADLSRSYPACATRPALVPVLVLLFSPEERLVNFDNAHEPFEVRVFHSSAEPMAHVPSSRVGRANLSFDLLCTDALLAVQHRVKNLKPCRERVLGILKNGSGSEREAIGIPSSAIRVRAFPMPRFVGQSIHGLLAAATRTLNALWPTARFQKFPAGFFGRERLQQLG
jgi:hypothetical protein